jgi:glucan phosphorylase
MVDIISVRNYVSIFSNDIKQKRQMHPLESNLVVTDIKSLLKLFLALKKTISAKSLRKNKDLEEKARGEAAEELKAELKKRKAGFTLPPRRLNIPMHKTSKTEQKMASDNPILEAKAEKKYRSVDKRYDAKLKKREEWTKLLLQKIDHTITPLRFEFSRCPEANKTLLVEDWPKLRKEISWRDFATPEMQEEVNRSIISLKTIIRKLRRIKVKILMDAIKWIYTVTIKAIIDSIIK